MNQWLGDPVEFVTKFSVAIEKSKRGGFGSVVDGTLIVHCEAEVAHCVALTLVGSKASDVSAVPSKARPSASTEGFMVIPLDWIGLDWGLKDEGGGVGKEIGTTLEKRTQQREQKKKKKRKRARTNEETEKRRKERKKQKENGREHEKDSGQGNKTKQNKTKQNKTKTQHPTKPNETKPNPNPPNNSFSKAKAKTKTHSSSIRSTGAQPKLKPNPESQSHFHIFTTRIQT